MPQAAFANLAHAARRDGSAAARLAGGAVVAILFMGSTLLTPLYELYRPQYGLSQLGLGLLYAVYVVGNLVALMAFGRLSDQLGRRPIVLASLALAAVSALLFLLARHGAWLFAGRIVSGLAVGIGSGAATAWISEATPADRRPRAASTMTAFNFAGLAVGPVLAGMLAQYAPWPLRLPFAAYLALVAATAVLAGLTPETLARPQRRELDLKPRLGVPAGLRLAFLAPAASGFAAMAVVGFYAALGPTLIRQSLGIANHALASLIVAELFVVAAVAIVLTRDLQPRTALHAGLLASLPGLGLLAAAEALSSWPVMLAGTTICGAAAALSYRGGLAVVNAIAPAERRAEMASSYFVCCFLGNALPIVGVAALSQAAGPAPAHRAFAGVLALLACAALGCDLRFGAIRPPSGRAP